MTGTASPWENTAALSAMIQFSKPYLEKTIDGMSDIPESYLHLLVKDVLTPQIIVEEALLPGWIKMITAMGNDLRSMSPAQHDEILPWYGIPKKTAAGKSPSLMYKNYIANSFAAERYYSFKSRITLTNDELWGRDYWLVADMGKKINPLLESAFRDDWFQKPVDQANTVLTCKKVIQMQIHSVFTSFSMKSTAPAEITDRLARVARVHEKAVIQLDRLTSKQPQLLKSL